MVTTYSTYDAKAKFSEVMRRVRDGETVIVSYRGDPVAEIKPIKPPKTSMEERMAELERRGVLVPAREPRMGFKPSAHRPGALKRFLEERNG
ncbi:MAG: type II toxin-antitoxin system prevent-host-death family antitoxin [Chloroflexi bacterium]|nr:type II toxin-antitoxin system prevent-host-death family antitoxin [Chloroflexota bacterium]